MKLRSVPASTGLEWVKLGIRTFVRQPLAMSGLFFLFLAAVSVLSLVPVVGAALVALLTPAVNLGLMVATREASNGRFPMPATLVSAFRAGPVKARSMWALGGAYGLCMIAVMALASLLEMGAPAAPAMENASPEALMQATLSSPALWTAMIVMLPLQMLFWMAPALLYWHGVPPVKSVFFSALACWANKGALIVFMLAWLGVFSLLGVVASLLGAVLGHVVLYPAVLFMVSMFFTSIYFVFRDSFFEAAEPAATPS